MMTDEERLTEAHERIRRAKQHMTDGETHADPVWQRRHLSRAATHLRIAANILDDNGLLSPDWDR